MQIYINKLLRTSCNANWNFLLPTELTVKIKFGFSDWGYKKMFLLQTSLGSITDMVNFLAAIRHSHILQAETLKTVWLAVAHHNSDPSVVSSDPLVNNYLGSLLRQAPSVLIYDEPIDMCFLLWHAPTIPSLSTT
jgi:hypothetical protein